MLLVSWTLCSYVFQAPLLCIYLVPLHLLYTIQNFKKKNCGDEQGLDGPHVQEEPRKLSQRIYLQQNLYVVLLLICKKVVNHSCMQSHGLWTVVTLLTVILEACLPNVSNCDVDELSACFYMHQ